MRNRVFGFCFIYLISLSFNDTVYALRRIDSIPTTMGCYRQPVTPISVIPTFHSDMSLDCLLGYIYFDSLCRGVTSHQIDSMVALIDSWDTMRVFMRFMYKMQEYDADLYKQYLGDAVALDSNYKVAPATVEMKLINRLRNLLGQKNKLIYLSAAPVVVHILVEDTTLSYDSLCRVPVWPQPRMCVSAYVIDTIKGMHLRPGDCGQYRSNKGNIPQAYDGCINIAYSPVGLKPHSRGDVILIPDDSAGNPAPYVCDSCYGETALVPGHEYIVFLQDSYLDFNGTSCFFEFTPYATYNGEGGVFPIDIHGNVLVDDNYFGYGTSVPLNTFKLDLLTDIQSIVSH